MPSHFTHLVFAEEAVTRAMAAAKQHPDLLPTDLGLDEMFATPIREA